MELSDYRVQIDRIDRQLVELFAQRMETAAGIAAYKKEHGLPVLDPIRERQKLQNVVELAPENMKDYTASLYTLLFELSRGYQNRLLGASTALTAEIQSAIDNTPKLFPSNVPVACQGVTGAYSQLDCDKLFKLANIMSVSYTHLAGPCAGRQAGAVNAPRRPFIPLSQPRFSGIFLLFCPVCCDFAESALVFPPQTIYFFRRSLLTSSL